VVAEPHQVPAAVIAVDGASVQVEAEDGRVLWFDLHPGTGHFVLRGDPYWGTRLRLLA
jgi:hypothetical protein